MSIVDEAHWSKLLQTCQSPQISSPPPASPPISPIAAFGQSVSRFFKWISPNRKATRTRTSSSMEDWGRATSVSSEEGQEPNYPKSPLVESRLTEPSKRCTPDVTSFANQTPTLLQTPSSSTLLTKRLNTKYHRIHKPLAVAPALTTSSYYNQKTQPSKPLSQSMVRASGSEPAHHPLTVALSCPLHQKPGNLIESSKEQLAATWPPIQYHPTYGKSIKTIH